MELGSNEVRGRLKIFFGYAAGVGKTYAMLEAAHSRLVEGADLVAGCIDTRGLSPETEAVLEGIERLSGAETGMLDLDAALARGPAILLVDELAQSNPEGARHAKRWQDVDELLASGISVWATLDVQELESLNDLVLQITGVRVEETLPDTLFDQADSVQFVDLPPAELRERLRDGRVRLPAAGSGDPNEIFVNPNLGALREIALRRTADRVHALVESSRPGPAGERATWTTSDTLLVCIGPSPTSARVIRTSRRMAASLNARWIAASVETSRTRGLGEADRQRLMDNIRLAERLGAETVSLSGDDVADEILSYARSQAVTRIVIGRSGESRWRTLLGQNVVDRLLRASGDIDIYVVPGAVEPEKPSRRVPRTGVSWAGYLGALGAVVVASLVALVLQEAGLSEANKAVVFIPAVIAAAMWWGLGPGILAAVLSVLSFDFFFVPPYFTLAVQDVEYVVTLLVLAAVALLVGTLAARLRRQVGTRAARAAA